MSFKKAQKIGRPGVSVGIGSKAGGGWNKYTNKSSGSVADDATITLFDSDLGIDVLGIGGQNWAGLGVEIVIPTYINYVEVGTGTSTPAWVKNFLRYRRSGFSLEIELSYDQTNSLPATIAADASGTDVNEEVTIQNNTQRLAFNLGDNIVAASFLGYTWDFVLYWRFNP